MAQPGTHYLSHILDVGQTHDTNLTLNESLEWVPFHYRKIERDSCVSTRINELRVIGLDSVESVKTSYFNPNECTFTDSIIYSQLDPASYSKTVYYRVDDTLFRQSGQYVYKSFKDDSLQLKVQYSNYGLANQFIVRQELKFKIDTNEYYHDYYVYDFELSELEWYRRIHLEGDQLKHYYSIDSNNQAQYDITQFIQEDSIAGVKTTILSVANDPNGPFEQIRTTHRHFNGFGNLDSMKTLAVDSQTQQSYTAYEGEWYRSEGIRLDSLVSFSYFSDGSINTSTKVKFGYAQIDTSDSTTSVISLDAEGQDKIRIFPNPANTFLNLVSSSDQIKKLEIYDTQARSVLTQSPQSGSTRINTSNLQDGVYILKVEVEQGTTFRTFIINH